jgi:hypothetical protein
MEYRKYPPSAELAPFVNYFWSLESDEVNHERILPRNEFTLSQKIEA